MAILNLDRINGRQLTLLVKALDGIINENEDFLYSNFDYRKRVAAQVILDVFDLVETMRVTRHLTCDLVEILEKVVELIDEDDGVDVMRFEEEARQFIRKSS
jgi:hypothetical protein